MKRNESILVYGVTGLLVVILLVAVVFGNEGTGSTPANAAGKATGKLANQQRENSAVGDLIERTGVDIEGKLTRRESAQPEVKPTTPESQPSTPSSQASPGAVGTDPKLAVALEAAFLLRSTREGDFRRVTVQDGESLSTLMERFGIAQARRDEVLRLNEMLPNLDRVRSGQQVILPWVDDAVLIAAEKQRRERESALAAEKSAARTNPRGDAPLVNPAPLRQSPPVANPKVVDAPKAPVISGATKERKVKKGESLWKIASECGGSVTHAIEQIRALNPNVDLDPLREGVTLKVPSK